MGLKFSPLPLGSPDTASSTISARMIERRYDQPATEGGNWFAFDPRLEISAVRFRRMRDKMLASPGALNLDTHFGG
jgi:hypothetical protein